MKKTLKQTRLVKYFLDGDGNVDWEGIREASFYWFIFIISVLQGIH